jgi:hypothetical protein
MTLMTAIPDSTKDTLTYRLHAHAKTNWPQLTDLHIRYRANLAYITGIRPDGEQLPLCRLRYGGSAHCFGFAIYSAAHDRYEDSVLLTGATTGTPQEALDTACTIHLTGLDP